MPFTTGVLLFDEAEPLDFAGPIEVYSMAKMEGDRVVNVAQSLDPVTAYGGMRVLPDCTFDDAPDLDVLVVPGGFGTRTEVDNGALVEWIKQTSESCTWVTSVCTGAFLLHAAGLLSGKTVTTHWGAIDELKERASDITIRDDVRYIRDGNVVTAAGVSAGIDMSLWVVGQLYNVEHARVVRRFMEYDPAPPYSAEV